MVRFNEWIYDDVPRAFMNDNNVSFNHMKEKQRKAELESHREKARQNLRAKIWYEPSYYNVMVSISKCVTIEELAVICGHYNLEKTWIKEEKVAMNKTDEIALLKRQIAELTKTLEKVEHGKWGKEPANGGMFQIEKKFSSASLAPKYKYLALRAAGMWYITGSSADARKAYTWKELQEFAGPWARVWKLTVAKELLD